MTALIDTNIVAKNFSDAAVTYDKWAIPQTVVARKLCTLLPDDAKYVLDIGCGTGLMTDLVRKRYPAAHITGIDPAKGMVEQCQRRFADDNKTTFIVESAEKYVAPASFDLVVASCSVQWFSNKQRALDNIYDSLLPEGYVAVAILIEGSLPELYESYRAAVGTEMPGLKLLPAEEYLSLFSQAGFTMEEVLIDDVRLQGTDPMYVINSLRGIGGAPPVLSHDSCMPQKQMKKLLEFYAEHFSIAPDILKNGDRKNGVDFTCRFLFGVASKKG
jgi:malonyl-CoA O-methyltransferase